MNPDSPKTPREEMETWLTSLLLGELSAGEAAAVRELIKHDPELAKLHDDLKSTIQLVRDVSAKGTEASPAVQEQPKLSAERREKLLAQFKTVTPREFAPRQRRPGIRLVELAAALVILAFLAAVAMPSLKFFRSERGYALWSAAEPETARLAADAAIELRRATMLAERLSSDYSAVTNYSAVTMRGNQAGATFSYDGPGDRSGGNLSFYSELGQSEPARRPVGLTQIPAKPATPIVLPALSSTDSDAQAKPEATYSYGIQVPRQSVTEWSASLSPSTPGFGVSAPQPAGIPAPPPPAAEPVPFVDPATGLPGATATGDATPRLEMREFAVNSEALHRAMGTESPGEDAFRRRYSPDSGLLTIPRVSVAGQTQGGGGGGGVGAGPGPSGANSIPPIVSDATAGDSLALSDTAQTRSKTLAESGPGFFGNAGQARPATIGEVDKAGVANRAQPAGETPPEVRLYARFYDTELSRARGLGASADQPAVAGEALVLGRSFTNASDLNGLGAVGSEQGKEQNLGLILSPASNVYSMDVVGYTAQTESLAKGIKSDSATPQPLMGSESLERYAKERGRVEELKDLTKPDSRRTLAELSDDSGLRELTLGFKVAEEKLASLQKDSATSATDLEQAQKEVTDLKKNAQVYLAKKRELEDMVDFQRLLTRKKNLEEIDLRLPKSSLVEIVEQAEAKNEPDQTFWRGIRSAVSGDVERIARVKVDRDKPDIEELSTVAGVRFNPYDPYFVQTELESIKSDAVLGKAAEQLGLSKDADSSSKKSEAIAELRKRLDLKAVPNSSVLEVHAKAEKPEEAAKIANTVAEVYRQWRLDKVHELVRAGLKSLEQQSREQEEKIRKAKVELAQLGQSVGISEADASELTKGMGTDLPIRKPSTNAPIPQPEIQTSENNFSTFSLNVSDVSFKLAAASLEKGQMPDAASVRSEEFINAFDYRDPEPATGAPIAFAWERARYPFAHNRDLLRFSLKTAAEGRINGRPLNLVLLLDNSGSMERADRVRIIREALRVLAGQLQPQDKLSVITFARTPRLVADGISGEQAGGITEAVSGLTPEGGTNLEEAMNLGYQTAARHYVIGGINRVVVLTDGAANLGDVQPESLKQKVEDARKQGIALDCFGIGWEGFNDDLLEVLSRNGDGRYGFINSPEEAASEFAGQLAGALKVAASDVKVQVEFNPRRVTSYRQIGYAKHQLTKEQFRDNTVDAAEIAAQEAGNALYTVEVNPAGAGPLCTVHVRYKNPGTTDYREQAWDVPYTGNAVSLEQSSPAMRLAASAAAFAEWLVASPFAGDVSPDAVLGYLRGVPEVFGADSRPKTLEWMIRQAGSIEGK